ncbi:MAG: conjugal transfer protein TraR [Halobacteriovoraceae bacterium]|nr:conjugal transfer protein TraR [Halobacteriovoraceae bacterium]|tara:strand:+ start:298 stop:720 length:423 start_codon:yes stop_codon:yes gene_type:complete
MSLKKRQLSTLKEKILSEKERILNAFDEAGEERFHLSTEDRLDEVDQATSEYERSQMLRFRNRDLFYVKKLNKALEKIASEEYGVCEDCDSTIKFERLMARPTAELCISCKDEAEREEQANFVTRQSKSMGKKIDLVGAR